MDIEITLDIGIGDLSLFKLNYAYGPVLLRDAAVYLLKTHGPSEEAQAIVVLTQLIALSRFRYGSNFQTDDHD
jgi:hypothetical protein